MFVTILLALIFVVWLVKHYARPENYPPGPPSVPLIGSWYSVPPKGMEKNVPEWRRKYGDIIGHRIGRKNLVIICDYEKIVSGMRHQNFQHRPHAIIHKKRTFFENLGLIFADDEQWNIMRRFTIHFFGQVSTHKLEAVMETEMKYFLSSIKSGQIMEVNNNEFTNFPLNVILTLLCGPVGKDQQEVKRICDATRREFLTGRPSGVEIFYSCLNTFFEPKVDDLSTDIINNFVRKRLEEHRRSFDQTNVRDFIDAFLLEQMNELNSPKIEREYFTDEELLSSLLDLIQPSSNSLGNAIEFLLLHVSLYPEVQQKMHEELDRVLQSRTPTLADRVNLPYCEAVINESRRLNPVEPMTEPHVASADTQFYGYTIPKGTVLFFAQLDASMDENLYENPTEFRPERFFSKTAKSKLLGFGLGKRSCIGQSISTNTMTLFVAYFFQRFSIALPKGHQNPSTEAEPGLTSSVKPFKIVVDERRRRML